MERGRGVRAKRRLPPLRERREDIESLARHFLARSAAELGVPVRRLDRAALDALRRFDYPGNIRQLENVCQWLTVMAPSAEVGVEDLPPEILGADAGGMPGQGTQPGQGDPPFRVPDTVAAPARTGGGAAPLRSDWHAGLEAEALDRLARREPGVMDRLQRDFERTLLRVGLRQAGGRRGEAALRLGIGRNTLTRKCRELGLDNPDGDEAPEASGG